MDENLMNYKIVMDYCKEQMELARYMNSTKERYEKASNDYKKAKRMFLIKLCDFCDRHNMKIDLEDEINALS